MTRLRRMVEATAAPAYIRTVRGEGYQRGSTLKPARSLAQQTSENGHTLMVLVSVLALETELLERGRRLTA